MSLAARDGPVGLPLGRLPGRRRALRGCWQPHGQRGCRLDLAVPALLCAFCLAAQPAPAASAAAAAAPVACRLPGVSQAVLCGSVRRALDPARPQGVMIEVHYAMIPALARRKADDAVLFFAGGPGQGAITLAGAWAARYARLGQRRDLVFVDQRGTGRSAPLVCPDDDERTALQPLASRTDESARLDRLRDCRRALQTLAYGDLRFFTTALAMADVDAVRQALGVARIDLVGGSYGTRAALELMRQFPATVRRAVLDGVAPPDMHLPDAAARDNQAALDALLAACAAEPACTAAHPDLRSQWLGLLQALPRDVTLPHPVTGRPESVRLRRDTVLALVRAPLYAPALAAALPAAIEQAALGRWSPLAALAGALGGGGGGAAAMATGMHFSVVCAEDLGPAAPPPDPADIAAAAAPGNVFGASFAALYRRACADWPLGRVDPAFYSLPPAPAPTWLLSGGLDPVTPPRHGARVALALGPKARHIVVANAGHGVTSLGCIREAVTRFINTDDDTAALATEADCAAGVPRPVAFAPPGSLPTPPASTAARAASRATR